MSEFPERLRKLRERKRLKRYVLIDKHDAPMEDVQQLAAELNHAAECVAEGYVTWAGVRRMLKEYNVEVELV